MRTMKDSGIEWVKNIPSTWDVAYLSAVLSERKNKNIGMKENNLLSLSYGNVIRKDITTSDGLLPESFEGYNIIEKDDIVLRLTDLQNDHRSLRTGLCKERGIITSAYCTLKKNSTNYDSRFLQYYLHSFDICKGFYGMGAGVRQGLNYDGIRQIEIVLPPLAEQTAIADCIAKKSEKVDVLIANQEAQIEKLKAYKQSLITEIVTKGLNPNVLMKDSGVEWIGLIPKHWRIISTKYLFQIESGATPKSENPEYFDGDIPWITPADYKTEEIFVSGGRRNISELGLRSCSTTLIPRGSLIFSKRAPIGAVAINSEELCTNQGCLSCIPKTDDNVKYYYYVMSVCTEQYNLLGSGTTFKEISATNFANFVLPNPSVCEQEEIVAYLDEKCSKVDRLIAIKNAKIDKLNQYKKSLIYEYVTGKKEVSC